MKENWKSRSALIGVILFSCLAFYLLIRHFDYQWTWNKIPQYFVAKHEKTLVSEQGGTVRLVDQGKSKIVEVKSDSGEIQNYQMPSEQVKVEDGETVFEGDVLGAEYNWEVGPLLQGLWITLELSFYSTLLGLFLGVLCGLGRISSHKIISSFSVLYVEAVRGTPLLVQLFIIYFMFGSVVGIESRFFCGVLALGIFAGAYVGEILRAGIEGIHHGQMEAARSLGMSHWQAMVHVIMPQVFKQTLPALAGTFISLIKDSSLVSVMALTDLTKAGREIVSSSFMVFETWLIVALLYFLLTFTFSYIFKRVEQRLAVGGKRS